MLALVYDSLAYAKTECKFDREELELFCEALEKNRKLNGLYMRSTHTHTTSGSLNGLFHKQFVFMKTDCGIESIDVAIIASLVKEHKRLRMLDISSMLHFGKCISFYTRIQSPRITCW